MNNNNIKQMTLIEQTSHAWSVVVRANGELAVGHLSTMFKRIGKLEVSLFMQFDINTHLKNIGGIRYG